MQAQATPGASEQRDYDAIVVGAGFSGLYMLHRLRQLGMTARLFDKADGVGGTWYWNRYPGARCDTPSVFYSYSFDPGLEQDWDWSETYPRQPEILRYMNHVADRFDLRRDMQLSTEVEQASWDDASNRWRVRTGDGETWTARFFLLGVGCLTKMNAPAIPGLDRFEGEILYTARWPREGRDLTGKRVGIVGTGSSAVQSIPEIAGQAAQLTVFQRTANFSAPARNEVLSEDYKRQVKANYGPLRQAARAAGIGLPPAGDTEPSAAAADPEARQRKFERNWAAGAREFYSSFADVLVNRESNEITAEFVRQKIRETVKDPATAEALAPRTHPIMTKRPCLDTNYYETYNRDNVALVDIRKTPIVEITSDGLRTTEAFHPLNVLVLATGFDAMAGAILAIDIRGRNGASLQEKWKDGPITYLGLQVAGFPNLFAIAGPGSPSVLINMPTAIEQHVEWIGDCLADMQSRGAVRIEASPEAEAAWTDHVREVGAATLYPLADSWYMGANIPGKARVMTPYAGGGGAYRKRCDEVAAKGYEGFVLSAAREPATAK